MPGDHKRQGFLLWWSLRLGWFWAFSGFSGKDPSWVRALKTHHFSETGKYVWLFFSWIKLGASASSEVRHTLLLGDKSRRAPGGSGSGVNAALRCLLCLPGKIDMVKSKWGLALAAVVTVLSSLLMSVGLCTLFGLTPTLNGG